MSVIVSRPCGIKLIILMFNSQNLQSKCLSTAVFSGDFLISYAKIVIQFGPLSSPIFLLYRFNAGMTIHCFPVGFIGFFSSSLRFINMSAFCGLSQNEFLKVIRGLVLAKNPMECYLCDWSLL